MLQRFFQSLKMSFYCLMEAVRSGQSSEYRIWRLKEAFGIDPERPLFASRHYRVTQEDKKHGRAGIRGHIPFCLCGKEGSYFLQYDSYYCPESRVWLEGTCRDSECRYCNHRPKKA